MPLPDMIPSMQAALSSEKPSTNSETTSEPSVTPTAPPSNWLALSDRLEPSELAYFKRVSEGLARSGQLAAEAANLERQATALRGAHESWVSYLVERYQLDPGADQIDESTGMIMRRAGDNGAS
jgi:hypothetical protein